MINVWSRDELDSSRVLTAMVGDDLDIDSRKYSLYMFSSSEPRWSRPRKCFRKHGYYVQG
jgi:hypothetical protein